MSAAWRHARRVLAVRLDGMGDVLMTGPALRAIADAGRRHVTLLASPAGAAIAPLLPGVRSVIVHRAPWMKATPSGAEPADDRRLVERLRSARFDAAIVFSVTGQTPHPAAMLTWLAGVPLRLAHGEGKTYQLLTDVAPEPTAGGEHEVERQLRLVRHVGYRTDDDRLRLDVPAAARSAASRIIEDAGLERDGRPWAVLHPGASAPSRRYPVDRYARAIRLLAERGWRVVLVGGESDRQQVSAVVRLADGAVSLVLTDLGTAAMAALIARAPLFIGNNSGPAHIAAAVGTPVVSLYALTNPEHVPWRVPARVLNRDVPCRGCRSSICPVGHHGCLLGVPPEAIVSAALDLVAGRAALAV